MGKAKKYLLKSQIYCLKLAFLFFTSHAGAQTDSLLEINVSGEPGKKAIDGRDGSDGSWSGSNGSNGANASPPTDGTDAGRIEMKIGEKVQGVLEVKARVSTRKQRSSEKQTFKVEFRDQGYIFPKALGGDAQRGGYGGDGGDGATGSDGSDATRYSSGTDGGRGGDGGDGGAGTNASEPGRGGEILIDVDEKDLSLLMLIEPNVSAGQKAAAGRHGKGGDGGRGGDGGSSYSWTETESYQTTNSDGETVTETRTTHHSNSGGSDGSRGRDGGSPSHSLYGSKGVEDGQVTYRVQNEKGIKEYSSRFDIEVIHYELESQNKDGILEPGETVFIKNLEIKNTGGMPTPSDAPIELFLNNQNHISTTGKKLQLSKSIDPGETHRFEDSLEFKVNDAVFTPAEERLRLVDRLSPEAYQLRANRPYQNEELVKELKITFPIEMEAITSLKTLAPGEATAVAFKITNISQRPFGSLSELKRNIEYYISQTHSDLKNDQIRIYDQTGGEIDLSETLLQNVQNLKPQQSTIVNAVIGVSPEALPYKATDYKMSLGLDKPTDSETREIQVRKLTIRTTQEYRHNPKSKILFVTNSEISEEVINSVKAQVAKFGEELTVWDLSYESHLDLNKRIELGNTLMKDFKDGLIIIPTNEFSVSSHKLKPENQLRKKQFLEAIAKNKTQVMFFGPERKESLMTSFLTPSAGKIADNPESLSELLKNFRNKDLPSQTQPHHEGGVFNRFSEVKITGTSFFGTPKAEDLKEKNAKFSNKIGNQNRNEKWLSVYSFEPKLIRAGLFGSKFGAKWEHGRIILIRTADRYQPSGLFVNVNENQVLSSEFTSGSDFKMSYLQAVGFEKNIEYLNKFITDEKYAEKNKDSLGTLMDSIQSYIAWEQALLKNKPVSSSKSSILSDAKYLEGLKSLYAINDKTPQFVIESMTQFWGKSLHLVNSDLHLWNFLSPFNYNEKVARVSRGSLRSSIEDFFNLNETFRDKIKKGITGVSEKDIVLDAINKAYKKEKIALRTAYAAGMWSRIKKFFGAFQRATIEAKLKKVSYIKNGRDLVKGSLDAKTYQNLIDDADSREKQAANLDQASSDIRKELRRPNPLDNARGASALSGSTSAGSGGGSRNSCSSFLGKSKRRFLKTPKLHSAY